ncbi:hypothetical protein A3Q56_04875 [Intoshia linei]|uniref:Uncharacterized protein n=1 Tax=Intoshia linei TaxID=1819745 RepID=A0A177B191_9BILA|nr:hypothetical protein A3Q56_04875 [Intoshia linei]
MRINGADLNDFLHKNVTLIGTVQKTTLTSSDMSFKFTTLDDVLVTVIMENPKEMELEGIIEVIGQAQSNNQIKCTQILDNFNEATNSDFDSAKIVKTIKLMREMTSISRSYFSCFYNKTKSKFNKLTDEKIETKDLIQALKLDKGFEYMANPKMQQRNEYPVLQRVVNFATTSGWFYLFIVLVFTKIMMKLFYCATPESELVDFTAKLRFIIRTIPFVGLPHALASFYGFWQKKEEKAWKYHTVMLMWNMPHLGALLLASTHGSACFLNFLWVFEAVLFGVRILYFQGILSNCYCPSLLFTIQASGFMLLFSQVVQVYMMDIMLLSTIANQAIKVISSLV